MQLTKHTTQSSILWGVTFSLTAMAYTGLAQTVTDEPVDEDADVFVLDEFTVSGEKLGRDVTQTMTSVNVIGASEVERNSDDVIQDAFRRIANVSGSRNATFSIRGISSAGSGFSSAPLASVFIDGVQTTFNQLNDGVGNLFDTEQIEVLRGPQSTSQGGAALAGAVILETRDPTFDWETILQAGYAEHETVELAVAQGGPLSESLAYRVVLDYDQSDGVVDNPTRGSDDYDFVDAILGRIKLLYQPSADDLRVLLNYTYYEAENGSNLVWDPTELELINRNPFQDTVEIEQSMLALEVEYALAEALRFESVSSGNWYDSTFFQNRVVGTLPARPEDVVEGDINDLIYTQEFRFLYEDQKWNALVGLYYNYKLRERIQQGAEDHITFMELETDFLFETYSIFGEADYSLTDKLTLTLGLRQEFVESRARDFQLSQSDEDEESNFLVKAGLRYTFSEDHVLGFTFSQGYRPGGVVFIAPPGFPVDADPYEPEFVDNYEIAYRGRFFDNRLSINANLFYLDWTDLQSSFIDATTFLFSVQNAGDARSQGGELEVVVRPITGLELFGSIGVADGEYVEFRSGFGNFDGNELADAPQFNAVAGFDYRWGRFSVGANVEYTGSYFADVQNAQELDSRTIASFNATYRPTRHLTLYLYVNNLFDEAYQESIGTTRPLVPGGPSEQSVGFVGDPRVIGVRARYAF